MVELNPSYNQELCYTAQNDRLVLSGLVCEEGVSDVTGGSLLVTTGGADLNVSIAQGGAFVQGDDDDQGMYSVYNDAPKTLLVGAADVTNPRIDQIIARVYDSTYGAGSDEWKLEVLPGVATAGATLANVNGSAVLPDNSLRLAYVLVPANFAGPFVNATHIRDTRTDYVACGVSGGPQVLLEAAIATAIPNTGAATAVGNLGLVHVDDEYFSVAAGVVTVLKNGLYDLMGRGWFFTPSGTPGSRVLEILAGGLNHREGGGPDDLFYGNLFVPRVSLTAGQTIQLRAFQTGSPGNMDLTNGRLLVRKVL